MDSTPERIIDTTNELFREFGYRGTGMKQVIVASGTTAGSVYHHFPGGKDELAGKVISQTGAAYQQLIEAVLAASPSLARGMNAIFKSAAKVLQDTHYVDPCPVGGVAREIASSHPELRAAAEQVLFGWIDAATEVVAREVSDTSEAKDLATLFVAAIEGGFLLSRTAQSPEPMLAIGRAMVRAVESYD